MEIEIVKYNGKDQPKESKHYPILSYKTVASPQSLLLVIEGTMSNEDNTESPFLEIMKVQFVASCKTDFSEQPLLVAFYIGEGGDLYPHLISSLKGNYFQAGESCRIIDYKAYADICEYTGETKLSLAEYLLEIKSGTLGTNAFLGNSGKFLNYDQQKQYYKELDESKIVNA